VCDRGEPDAGMGPRDPEQPMSVGPCANSHRPAVVKPAAPGSRASWVGSGVSKDHDSGLIAYVFRQRDQPDRWRRTIRCVSLYGPAIFMQTAGADRGGRRDEGRYSDMSLGIIERLRSFAIRVGRESTADPLSVDVAIFCSFYDHIYFSHCDHFF